MKKATNSLSYARLPMHRLGTASLAEALSPAEREFARRFMRELAAATNAPGIPPLLLLHAEDVVVSYCLVNRIEQTLFTEGPLPERNGEAAKAPAVHPALDAASKARERLRKAMKELETALEGPATGDARRGGLADALRPLLKQAEGALEEALETGEPRPSETTSA